MHTCPMVTPGTPPIPHVGGPITGPGAPTVLIGGQPAAVVGDMATCIGPPSTIIKGSTGVMIGGKPAARMGDQTAHGGVITLGCPTVLIGEAGGGGGAGGPSGAAAGGASAASAPKVGSASTGFGPAPKGMTQFRTTGGKVDPARLNPELSAARTVLAAQGRPPDYARTVLESGKDFRAREFKPNEKLYGFVTAGEAKSSGSAFWVDEEAYARLSKVTPSERKQALALPCTNRADGVVSAIVTKPHTGVESTVGPAADLVYKKNPNGTITRRPLPMPGGEKQVTPSPRCISLVK